MFNDIYQEQSNEFLMNTYGRYPMTLVRGKGAYVWDIQDKKYLDFLSGIGCTVLGHCHPVIEKAVITQMKKILHTSNLYFSKPNIELAKWIVQHGGLDKIFFSNSGAEANETAIKLARKFHWKKGHYQKNMILSATRSFHGRTLGALAATGQPSLQEGFGPMPIGFQYQSWHDGEAFYNAINDETAAVIIEPIQGEGGIHVAPKDFLKKVRYLCDLYDVVLIFDEVQCGIGRTGELFAYQDAGVQPDVITLAKGIANGLPLGAVCAKQKIAETFLPKDHGTTFGGNPICCAAALANFKTLWNQDYLSKVKQLGFYFLDQLKALQMQHPTKIKEIRGRGLMLGIQLTIDAKEVLAYCRKAGLLVNVIAEHVIRLLPPYIINRSNIDFAMNVFDEAIKMQNLI